jgi:hypothetical protein
VIFGITTVEERREGKREGRKEGRKNGRKYTGMGKERKVEKATKGKRWEGQKRGRAKQDRTERAKRRTLEAETPPIHIHRTHTPVGRR